ncbi:thioredoxin-like protein CXXS1 isoform X2 [Pistacia vera]|uniref:thioredoxin-like protein CXXS1 isoform X2 n=1 Tax=Pistacia vera TaxID=55513 RepID=UPI001263D17E|nr:thioredoxin-like protein CXXS1 isoform X2 [Pistacia vera]
MEGQDEQNKSRVVKVDSAESWDLFVSQANNQGCPIVVHFTASWCMPSVAMNSFFEEVAAANPDVLFLCIDVDEVKTFLYMEMWVASLMTTTYIVEDKDTNFF